MSSIMRRYTLHSSVNCSLCRFYVLYLIEWCVRCFQYGNRKDAYYNISFEREAYKHGNDLSYLKNRKLYSWMHFLRLYSNRI